MPCLTRGYAKTPSALPSSVVVLSLSMCRRRSPELLPSSAATLPHGILSKPRLQQKRVRLAVMDSFVFFVAPIESELKAVVSVENPLFRYLQQGFHKFRRARLSSHRSRQNSVDINLTSLSEGESRNDRFRIINIWTKKTICCLQYFVFGDVLIYKWSIEV